MRTGLKKKIISLLFVLSILLLMTDLVIGKLYPDINKNSLKAISEEEADTLFENTLENFGIEREWYNKTGEKYSIRLPVDLPAELIVLDITDNMADKNVEVHSRELVKGSRSLLEIISDGETVLTGEFIYDKTKARRSSYVSFIVLNSEYLNISDYNTLISLPEKFTYAFIPAKRNRWLADSISLRGKEYSVLLNGEIDELEYRLDEKFSDNKIRTTIQSIISHFPLAEFYIIDNSSDFYSPRVKNLIEKEFKRRRISYHPIHDFFVLEEQSFNDGIEKYLTAYRERGFLIQASDYLNLNKELKQLRKRGYKFTSLSALQTK